MAIPVPEVVARLVEALEIPRAAFAYGIDTRELRHNAFLHFLMGPLSPQPFWRTLLREIATISMSQGHQVADWKSLSMAEIVEIVPLYNVSARAGRPDEILVCRAADGQQFDVVIEMKVKAPKGHEQLEAYVKNEREKPQNARVKVLGLLLRIPGRDAMHGATFPFLRGVEYQHCLIKAREHAGSPTFNWLVDDYVSTLQFMDLMDRAIIEHSQWLFDYFHHNLPDKPLLRSWINDNWRWIGERIMRAVENLSCEATSDWKGGAYTIKDGAAVDFESRKTLAVGTRGNGASLYCHWKLGSGFEVRPSADGYGGKPTDASRATMHELCARAQQSLRQSWSELEHGRPRNGKDTCMVVRLPNPTYCVQEIARELARALARIEATLVDVVASFPNRSA